MLSVFSKSTKSNGKTAMRLGDNLRDLICKNKLKNGRNSWCISSEYMSNKLCPSCHNLLELKRFNNKKKCFTCGSAFDKIILSKLYTMSRKNK